MSCSHKYPVKQGPQGPKKASAVGRLGRKRQYFHPKGGEDASDTLGNKGSETQNKQKKRNDFRRETAADVRQAAKIYRSYEAKAIEDGASLEELEALAGRGVTMCGWTQIAGFEEGGFWRAKQKGGGFKAFERGHQQCGLRGVCPVCAAKRGQEDREWVNDALAQARKEKLFPVMITYTARHSRRDKPAAVLRKISTAEQRLKRLKCWKRLKGKSDGYCRVLETTWGGKNGHHPHFHTVVFVKAASELEAIREAETLKASYMDQLQKAGADGISPAAWKHSFQVQGASAIKNYITKWGLAEEITGAQSKDAGGLTPWQLLRMSRTDPDHNQRQKFAALWWEIINAMKGKTQLHKSTEFIALAERFRETKEEEEQFEPELILSTGIRDKGCDPTKIFELTRMKRLAIKEAIEVEVSTDDAKAAARFALREGSTDTEILDGLEQEDGFNPIDDGDDLPARSAAVSSLGALDTSLPVTDSSISKRGSATAHGDQQQKLLEVGKQLGEAFDRGCGDQATGCTNQQLTNELRHGVSKIVEDDDVSERKRAPRGSPDTNRRDENNILSRSGKDAKQPPRVMVEDA